MFYKYPMYALLLFLLMASTAAGPAKSWLDAPPIEFDQALVEKKIYEKTVYSQTLRLLTVQYEENSNFSYIWPEQNKKMLNVYLSPMSYFFISGNKIFRSYHDKPFVGNDQVWQLILEDWTYDGAAMRKTCRQWFIYSRPGETRPIYATHQVVVESISNDVLQNNFFPIPEKDHEAMQKLFDKIFKKIEQNTDPYDFSEIY